MGALAAAGCAWSASGDPGYGGKWAGLARHGRCTPSSWTQRAVRVDCGLSYTTVEATIVLSPDGVAPSRLVDVSASVNLPLHHKGPYLFSRPCSQPSQIGCLPYFHRWSGLSANLECIMYAAQ